MILKNKPNCQRLGRVSIFIWTIEGRNRRCGCPWFILEKLLCVKIRNAFVLMIQSGVEACLGCTSSAGNLMGLWRRLPNVPNTNVQINNEACVSPLSELVGLVVLSPNSWLLFFSFECRSVTGCISPLSFFLFRLFLFSVVAYQGVFHQACMHLCVCEVLLRSCIFTPPGYHMQLIFSENSNWCACGSTIKWKKKYTTNG